MKNVMKEAHKLTKEIKREYPNVDYKAQLGICISYLMEGDNISKRAEEIKAELGVTEEEAVLLETVEKHFLVEYGRNEKILMNLWENYGKKRVYIKCRWRSKYADTGVYFDLNNKYLYDKQIGMQF